MVCGLPVIFKQAVGNDVMNVHLPTAHAARLARAAIALANGARLTAPVWAAIANRAADVIWITSAALRNGIRGIPTSVGAVLAVSENNLYYGCVVLFSAVSAILNDMEQGIACRWSGAARHCLITTLKRAKLSLTGSEVFKLFTTSGTGKGAALARLAVCQTTEIGAKLFSPPLVFLAAVLTRLHATPKKVPARRYPSRCLGAWSDKRACFQDQATDSTAPRQLQYTTNQCHLMTQVIP